MLICSIFTDSDKQVDLWFRIQIVSIASMRCGSILDVRLVTNQKSELLLHYVEGDLIKIFKTLKHKNSPFHQYFFRCNVPLSIFNENPSDFSDLL